MSSAGPSPAAPRPSLFLSYASEDRAAARELRDVLTAAGLEVWYDETELGGGDAWDRKIRRQIRDCDYFMPVISATTERRKEGYFRREWRLAAERTLDMADDVLFLVPVAIDDTTENGARVPEKFQAVQWLRAPGGRHTPALDGLMARLVAGEHSITPRPPLVTRPSARDAAGPRAPASTAYSSSPTAPTPMPPFPPAPEKGGVGHWLKYLAEVLWWAITAAGLVFARLPKWLRVMVAIWIVFLLVSTCRTGDSSSRRKPREGNAPASAHSDRAVVAAADQVAAPIEKNAKNKDRNKFGEEVGRRSRNAVVDPSAAGKRVLLVPFATRNAEADAGGFAGTVFSQVDGQLSTALLADMAVTRMPTPGTDTALVNLGRTLDSAHVLGGRLVTTDGKTHLLVQLINVSNGGTAWQGEFPVVETDPTAAAGQIAQAVLKLVPPRARP